MRIPFLLGRILFGGFFVYNGINHFRQRHALAQYARAKKMPKPEAAVVASGALLLLGGGSILLGMKPKYGALATMVFLAAASAKIHDFWNAEDPNQKMNDMINFSKNLALFGASMALMSVEEPCRPAYRRLRAASAASPPDSPGSITRRLLSSCRW